MADAIPSHSFTKYKDSGVWKFFTRRSDGQRAKCDICLRQLIIKDSSTGTLWNHLGIHKDKEGVPEALHGRKRKLVDSAGCSSSKITKYATPKESMHKRVARLAVLDRVSFNRIAKSKDLRAYFVNEGFKLPTHPTTIKNIVLEYGNELQKEISRKLREHIEMKRLPSLTMDEWTSTAHRRYANINAHVDGATYNLGLWRCFGSMDADRCKELCLRIVSKFDLKVSEVVGITTDAASVMVKMGENQIVC